MKESYHRSAVLASFLGLVPVAGLSCSQELVAGTNAFNEKSIKQWTLKGPLTELPQRVSEVLPLSDQQNKAGWVKFEPMWDEFDGSPRYGVYSSALDKGSAPIPTACL